MTETNRDTYHHGDLRTALVDAAETMIREDGIEGFSLRKVAKVAGVSPGAPAHHFAGVKALLTEVAIRSLEQLGHAIAARKPEGNPKENPATMLREGLQTYVLFAKANPGLFLLQGRNDLVDYHEPRLQAAAYEAVSGLLDAAAAYTRVPAPRPSRPNMPPEIAAVIATAHGLAHLAVEGRFFLTLDKESPDRDFRDRLLPQIAAAAWPDRTR